MCKIIIIFKDERKMLKYNINRIHKNERRRTVRKEIFLKKAAEHEPVLYEKKITSPVYGKPVCDSSNWFLYRWEQTEASQDWKAGESRYLDFGDHHVGYFSFRMKRLERYPDAPVRVHIKFAENLRELESDYEHYTDGLYPSWLQQETVYLDEPSVICLPRRYAFRYVKFTVDTSPCPVIFEDFEITAVSSADENECRPVRCESGLAAIDRVGIRTLQNCMQRIFEDGPKRDRRLWLGDLRIQALVGYDTFRNMDLVKKCLYLFAAHSSPGKKVSRAIFENSRESIGDKAVLDDYALMFAVSLSDYYEHTGDGSLVDELFDIADEQIQLIVSDAEEGIVKEREGFWTFIDWCDGLKKVTAMQGVLLYTLRKMIGLCKQTGREKKAEEYRQLSDVFTKAAREKLFDTERGLFVNKMDDYQISLHAQVWMTLGHVVDGTEAQDVFHRILRISEKKEAVTPYMHHYLTEALLEAGMKTEALEHIKEYWGGMVKNGADTYWEVYVPGKPEVSPYGNPIMNSGCHAWSCSASYFIRTYFKEVQNET